MTEKGVAMKDKQCSLAAAIITANLAMGASAVFAQSFLGPSGEKLRLELLKQTQPTIWQAAQAMPG
jgi:hypothetical protein